jgi:hypothetical protein
MNARAASSTVAALGSRAAGLALLALVAAGVRPADAGVLNVPCRRPFIFEAAAVNVVVLPYESTSSPQVDAQMGARLSGLLQLEVLRSIAKFGSVGAVQLVGTPTECDPDVVTAKLLGSTPGATTTLRKGQGLVVVWGRFYSEGGSVFVQAFCRLLRAGVDETVELTVARQPFSGQISAQAFACAPRRVTTDDIVNFEREFARANVLREAPDENAGRARFQLDAASKDGLPFWISDTRGDWMKITSQGLVDGWIRLSGTRDAWSLARWLPELAYIEGMVGYLRYRVAAQPPPPGLKQPGPAPSYGWESRVAAQPPGPVRAEWIEGASRALVDYEGSFAPSPTAPEAGPALPWRTALAGVVELQLRGVLIASKPNATADDRVKALALFQRAASLLPHDPNARSLVAMMQLSLALDSGYPGLSPKQAVGDLLKALGSDPGNARLLANLRSAYQALLSPAVTSVVALSEEERRSMSEHLEAIKQIR